MATTRKKATRISARRRPRPAARSPLAESTTSGQFYGGGQTPRTVEPEPTAGRYPRGHGRPDERITEEVRDRLTAHSYLDASDIEVSVREQQVALRGRVSDGRAKSLAQDVAKSVAGVHAVRNELRVRPRPAAKQPRAG